MRTKTTLAAAAILAAGLASSMAQNVYSLNVVGYVNVPVPGNGKLTLVSSPFVQANGNYNITNTVVMPDTAIDATIYAWAGTAWNGTLPQYFGTAVGWVPNFSIPLGNAFFIQTAVGSPDTQVTFVGDVAQGTASNGSIPVGLSVQASRVPVADRQPGGTVGGDGDSIYTWNQAGQAWGSVIPTFIATYGWDDGGAGGASTNGPALGVASGFFYNNVNATAVTWNRNFTVQ